MTGNVLNVAFPNGITPTVSGVSNAHVVSLSSTRPTGAVVGSTSLGFPGTGSNDGYYADPVVSVGGTCASTTSLFSGLNVAAAPPFAVAGSGDFGITFTSDAAQSLCGVRYFKSTGDTATTHTMAAWSTSGTMLASATTSGETASGWQTATFATPVPLLAGTQYVVSYHTTVGWPYSGFEFQNADYYNTTAHLHVSGSYVDSNGAGNATDAWPRAVAEINGYQGPAAGEIAYIDISGSGTTSDLGNADLQSTHVNVNPSSEGCQCMVGGVGPGPYIFQDNFIEGTGNVWHHDNSGSFWDPGRNDYTYYRNYWHMPAYAWLTGPYSDGNRYGSRHFLEWKDGKRISIKGNIFNRWFTDETPTDEPFEISAKDGQTTSDLYIAYNSMFHGPGGPLLGVQEATAATNVQPAPAMRSNINNNLAWDIDGTRYCLKNSGFGCPTAGWFMDNLPGEDSVVDHNTVLINTGSNVPVLIYTSDMPVEGVQVTNNFMMAENSKYSFSWYDNGPNDSCHGIDHGEALANCKLTPSYVWAGNVFVGSGVTAAQIESAWPNHIAYPNGQPMNYFNANIGSIGWFSYNPGNTPAGGNFRLKSTYCSGCAQHATDGTDVGANIDALEAAQGVVTLSGVPSSSLTSNSATVVFVAPDTAGCSVDYSSSDATVATSFTRVADAGGARVRNINLTGLTGATLYYYRVNCAVQQPAGQFHTR